MATHRRLQKSVCSGARRCQSQGRTCSGEQSSCGVAAHNFWEAEPAARCFAASASRAEAFKRAAAKRHDEKVEREAAKTADLARARLQRSLSEVMHRRIVDEKRTRAREESCKAADVSLAVATCPELQALHRRCQEQRASQQRAVQLLDQEVRVEEDRLREVCVANEAERSRFEREQLDLRNRQHKEQLSAQFRTELLGQAEEDRRRERERRGADQLQARQFADQSFERLCDEDRLARERQITVAQEVREALGRLVERRQRRDDEEVASDAKATLRAEMEQQQAADFAARLAAQRREAENSRQRVIERVSEQLDGILARQLNLEEVRDLLWREEALAEQRRKNQAELRRRQEMREAQTRAWEESLFLSGQQRRAAEEEALTWRAEALARMAEEDRLEQLGARRRQTLLAEHRQAVEKLAVERREAADLAKRREAQEFARQREQQDVEARILMEERDRLLREHDQVLHEVQDLWTRAGSAGYGRVPPNACRRDDFVERRWAHHEVAR